MRLYVFIYACVIFKVVRADIHAIESGFVACTLFLNDSHAFTLEKT